MPKKKEETKAKPKSTPKKAVKTLLSLNINDIRCQVREHCQGSKATRLVSRETSQGVLLKPACSACSADKDTIKIKKLDSVDVVW